MARDSIPAALWQTFWVGYRRPSPAADFQWVDGSPKGLLAWGAGEPRYPDALCAALSVGDGSPSRASQSKTPLFLESVDCATFRPFICDLDAAKAAAQPWVTGNMTSPMDPTRVLALAATTWRNWEGAQELCQRAGGHLAVINADQFLTTLLSALQSQNTYLVGTQNASIINVQPVAYGTSRIENGRVMTDVPSGLAASNGPQGGGCTIWERVWDTFKSASCQLPVAEVACFSDSVRQDPVEAKLGNKTVLFFSVSVAFDAAIDRCAAYNASLLEVESAEENAALMALAAVHMRGQPLFINARGDNRTKDGRELLYTNYVEVAVGSDLQGHVMTKDSCVVVSPMNNVTGRLWPGAWRAISCLKARFFVCQQGNAVAAAANRTRKAKDGHIRGAVNRAANSMGISAQGFVIMLTLLIAGGLLTAAFLTCYCCCRRPGHAGHHSYSNNPKYTPPDLESAKPPPPRDDARSPRDQPQTCVRWPATGAVGCVGPSLRAGGPAADPNRPPPPPERGSSPWHKVLNWLDVHPLPLPPTQRDRTPPPQKPSDPQGPPPHPGAPRPPAGPAAKPPHPQSYSQSQLQLATMPLPSHHLATSPTLHLASHPNLHSGRLYHHKSPSASTSNSHSQLGVACPADFLLLDSTHSTAPRSRRWPSDPQLHEDPPLAPPPTHSSPPKALFTTSSSHSWTSGGATPSLEPPSTPNPRTDTRTPPELRSQRGSGITYHVNSLALLSDSEWGSPRETAMASGSHLAVPSSMHHASEQWSTDSDDHPHTSSTQDPPSPHHLAPFAHAYIRSMPWDITPGHTATIPLAHLSPPSRTGSVHRSSCPTVAPSLHIQTTPPPDPLADTTLPSPSFHITSAQEIIIHTDCKLGQGASGTVFRGEFRSASVAVKVIDVDQISSCKEAAEQERVLASYRQEIAVLSRINHPNILRMYGACMDPPKFLVVEELMHKSLAAHIHGAPLGRLPLGEALRVGGAIASGLQHLHPFVVHRDLKPQNVLLSEMGDVKIGDFGAARIKLDTYLTESAHMAGTVPYMAPECLRCDSGVSEKCDIYSLGVIIWEAVTGLKPWAGERAVGIIYRVALQGHRLLPPPTCPPTVAELIDRCLDFDPRNRPDAEEVVARVDTLLDHLDSATLAAPMVVIGGPPQTGERSLFPRAALPPPDEISQEVLRLQQLPFSRRGTKVSRHR